MRLPWADDPSAPRVRPQAPRGQLQEGLRGAAFLVENESDQRMGDKAGIKVLSTRNR